MIVSCPSCATNYQVDERALGPNGRMVRCAQCSHTWHQMPSVQQLVTAGAEAASAASEIAEPAPEPPRHPPAAADEPIAQVPPLRSGLHENEDEAAFEPEHATPARRRRSPMAAIGWVLLLLIIAGVVGGGIWQRKEVIAYWPPSLKLYEFLGLETVQPSDGLVIHANPRRDEQNGVPRLVIEGDVINSATVALPVPQLKVELKDAGQRVVQTWTFAASTDRLLPGASVPFTTSVERPNESATSMSVSFVDEEHQ